jgi:hypothetical protein
MEPPSILSVVSLIFGLVRGFPVIFLVLLLSLLIFLVLLLSLLLLFMVLFLILLVLLNDSSDTVVLNRIPVIAPILGTDFRVLFLQGSFFYGGVSPSKIGPIAPY